MAKSRKTIITVSIITVVVLVSAGGLIWNNRSAYNKEIEAQIMDEEGIRNVGALSRAISLYFEKKTDPELCHRDESGNRLFYHSNKGTDKMDGMGWLPLDFSSLSAEDRDSIMSALPAGDGDRTYEVYCDEDGRIVINTKIQSAKYASLAGVIGGFFDIIMPGFGPSVIYYQERTSVDYTPHPDDKVTDLSGE